MKSRATPKKLLRLEQLEDRRLLTFAATNDWALPYYTTASSSMIKVNAVDSLISLAHPWQYLQRPDVTLRETTPGPIQELSIVKQPQHGVLRIAYDANDELRNRLFPAGPWTDTSYSVVYTPNRDFEGFDSFEYRIGGLDNPVSTYSMRIAQPIYAADDWFRVDVSSVGTSLNVLANDQSNYFNPSDPDYQARFKIVEVASASGASLSISPDGRSLSYSQAISFEGVDTFTYTVEDSDGYRDTAMVAVRVAADTDAEEQWPERLRYEWAGQILRATSQRFGIKPNDYIAPYTVWNSVGNFGTVFATADSNGVNASERYSLVAGNDQVSGVHENDLVQADGSFVYVLSNRFSKGKLTILDVSSPALPEIVSELELPGWQLGFHLFGDRLAIVSSIDQSNFGNSAVTTVTLVDISDRTSPGVLRSSKVQGTFNQSRQIDDKLYVFTNNLSPYPQLATVSGFNETASEFFARIDAELDAGPRIVTTNHDATSAVVSTTSANIDFNSVRRLVDDWSLSLMGVFSFDVDANSPGPFDTDSLVIGWDSKLYVSSDNIYIVRNASQNQGEGFVSQSIITQLTLDRVDGGVDETASGTVKGTILNSFSMAEYNGDLRIVTTITELGVPDPNSSTFGVPTPHSKLTVLRAQGNALIEVGSIDDIAPGEQVQSARFEDDKAYIVTFRQIDPLFIIDLHDPANPVIEGELKVPGYSQYLHKVDATHLLGVGRDVGADGLDQGMIVSLFDVADPANPKLASKVELGASVYSPLAAWRTGISDHRAIGLFLDKGIVAIPLLQYSTNWQSPNQNFVGVFKIESSTITMIGKVESAGEAGRVMQFGEYLYSFGTDSVDVHELLNPSVEVSTLSWADAMSEPESDPLPPDSSPIDTLPFVRTGLIEPMISLRDNVWRNPSLERDVNGDGAVDPIDVLNIINFLNAVGPGSISELSERSIVATTSSLKRHFDANGDGAVGPQDALVIINHINALMETEKTAMAAEAESTLELELETNIDTLAHYIVDLDSVDPLLKRRSATRGLKVEG